MHDFDDDIDVAAAAGGDGIDTVAIDALSGLLTLSFSPLRFPD